MKKIFNTKNELVSNIEMNRSGNDLDLFNKRLWSADDCSIYFGISLRTCKEKVLKNCTFPKPLVIYRTENKSELRWRRNEVEIWAYAQKI